MKQFRTTAPPRARRGVLAVAAIAAVSLAVVGCAPTAEPEAPLAEDQTLVFGLSGEPQDVKPGADQGAVGTILDSLVHASLLRYDAEGTIIPNLAAEFEQVDPATYSFTLQEGAVFSDGTPVTSDNVASTFEFYADPANGAKTLRGFANVEEVEVVDDSNFIVHLASNDGDFLQYVADPTAFIAPEDALVAGGIADIGAGPFVVASGVDGVSTTLEANPEFWDAANITLESIELVFYPDTTARSNALLSGDVDLIDFVAWEDFDRVAATDGLVLDAVAGPWMDVEFNVTDGPLADPLVRQAIAYALNRDAVAAAAYAGHAKPLYGVPLGEGSPFASELSESMFEYDPEHAKELLEEAGYPDGFSTTLLTTSQYAFYADAALVVQSDLAEIGIEVTLDSPDWAGRNAKSASGEYELRLNGSGGVVTSPTYLAAFYGGPPAQHSFGYVNDDLLAAFDEGRTAESEADAKEAYDEAFRIIAEDVPAVYLVQREQGFAFKDTVNGFVNLPGFLTFYSGYTLAYASISAGE